VCANNVRYVRHNHQQFFQTIINYNKLIYKQEENNNGEEEKARERVDAAAAYIFLCGTRRPAVRATYARIPRLRLADAISRPKGGKRRSPKLYIYY